MKLRQYQINSINNVIDKYKLGSRRVCCVLPCGAGKTILFAYMANNHVSKSENNHVWFIVHRKELINQTREKFEMLNIHSDRIHIYMVGTLANKIRKGENIEKPTMVIFDECHHCVANTWETIINYVGDTFIVGLTATPCRLDGTGLGNVFDSLSIGVNSKYLITNGYLSHYDYYAPKINVDFSEFKQKGKDYDNTQVGELFEKSKIYGDVIQNYINIAKGKKSILYAPSIEFSNKICKEFQNHNINAVHFDGNTPSKDREQIIKDFKNNKIQILSNVDLIGEGFDVPDCECCLLLRPTMSLALYIQQSMRCMRYQENKKSVIIDYVGNCFRHGLPDEDREWSLEGKQKCRNQSAEKDIISRECSKCHRVYSGIAPICPYCGNDNHKTRKQIEQEQKAELERITEIDRKAKRQEVGMSKTMDQLIKLAIQRGYSNPHYWARCVYNSRERKKH